MPKLDLHVHSSASFDCRTAPRSVVRRCGQLGLGPVVLTDHDSLEGALALRAAGVDVIAGQEITTSEGELIGLFLERPVPAGLGVVATAQTVRDQGGLVYLQHPYDDRRRCLGEPAIEALANLNLIDIVEVWNGRSPQAANEKAAGLRQTLGAVAGAGSDAHRASEIGRAYVELAPFTGAADFLEALRSGRVIVEPRRALMRVRAALGR